MTPASIGVVGAGVMGSGIAQCLATAGYRTVCYDISPEQLERARQETVSGRYGIDRGVARGKLTTEQGERAKALLAFTTSFEEAADNSLVLEVVPEDLGLKVDVLRRLDAAAPAGAILASNTSGFPIVGLAQATDRPDRVIGWHWASPPAVMRLAEIVVTPLTAPDVVDTVVRLSAACGKNPIVVRDTPMVWGFVPNRLLAAMYVEAQRIVAEGVCTAEELDRLCVDCFNWPTGPFGVVGGAKTNWKDGT